MCEPCPEILFNLKKITNEQAKLISYIKLISNNIDGNKNLRRIS